MQVTLNDRNAEEVVLWNALVITDISAKFGVSDIDMTIYEDAAIIVRSTLDQALTLRVQSTNASIVGSGNLSDQLKTEYSVNIPANSGRMVITKSDWDILGGPFLGFKLYVTATVAPISGSISGAIIRRKR